MLELEEEFKKNGGFFKGVPLGDVFNVDTPKKKINANRVKFGGKYPYVVRTSLNNGIRGYIDYDPTYLNPGNTISFGQDTATAFYQEEPYFTGDKIKIFSLKNNSLTPKLAVFLLAAMKCSFQNFSWGNSSFSEKILKNVQLVLPFDSNDLAFDYMEQYVRELEAERVRELEAYLLASGLNDYQLTDNEREILTGGG